MKNSFIFLKEMNRDLQEKIDNIHEQKRKQDWVDLWVVTDGYFNYAHFKENDYTNAVARLIEEIKKESITQVASNLDFSLRKMRYPAIEADYILSKN